MSNETHPEYWERYEKVHSKRDNDYKHTVKWPSEKPSLEDKLADISGKTIITLVANILKHQELKDRVFIDGEEYFDMSKKAVSERERINQARLILLELADKLDKPYGKKNKLGYVIETL